MGCCGYKIPLSYPSSKQVLIHPILLQTKKSSLPKKVRFEISYTDFKKLSISEETHTPWYESIINANDSEWKTFKSSEKIALRYFIDGKKQKSRLLISLNVIISHEVIVYLINNPEYRVIWDNQIKKMQVLIGDRNLDASVALVENHSDKSLLIERTVRKYKGGCYMTYVMHEGVVGKDIMVISACESEKIVVDWVEEIEEESEILMERKFLWGNLLFGEILIHTSS